MRLRKSRTCGLAQIGHASDQAVGGKMGKKDVLQFPRSTGLRFNPRIL